MTIDFTGQVAIVTGAGGGLGRSHALMLAARGAHVLVNDLGAAPEGASPNAPYGAGPSARAEQVAAHIRDQGGDAIAHGGSVTDRAAMEDMARTAMARWGRIDILINNAGNLHDKSFAKMDMADFAQIIDVNLTGAAQATHAVWNIMREQNYGRILMTTSGAGLFGNFGQANYSAAKMGLVGLARTLQLEGARHDIRVNLIAPLAATAMLASVMPEELLAKFDPADVSAMALYLVSRHAPRGTIIGAGGGAYQAAHILLTEGIALPPEQRTPEGIADAFARITDRSGATAPHSGGDQAALILKKLAALGQDKSA